MDFNDDGVCNLLNAVVVQACRDYSEGFINDNTVLMQECKRFITGDKFISFTEVNGEYLIKKIEEESMVDRMQVRKIKNDLVKDIANFIKQESLNNDKCANINCTKFKCEECLARKIENKFLIKRGDKDEKICEQI